MASDWLELLELENAANGCRVESRVLHPTVVHHSTILSTPSLALLSLDGNRRNTLPTVGMNALCTINIVDRFHDYPRYGLFRVRPLLFTITSELDYAI